ncbi:hypothetical protein [Proteiniclasticum sp. QWL-01]|uniref:hypothetical protein n=1 Tax=Proteiniclasticum sp. QWL-01 TaxID=3036945 RepID=UPI0024115625|nr:hypothetical protein [Proteiniclasticum sp. QWL-01]WFF73985.1 hypothetical protein P6M73_05930 [Proteiniclasticum sp. QWL-01]
MTDLTNKWLWMQTMNYALDVIKSLHQRTLYPLDTYHEWKHVDYDDQLRNVFEYALTNWETVTYQGKSSKQDRYSMGYDLTANGKGVSGTYRDYEVQISWGQVQKFIRDMLDWQPEDSQVTMFEFLSTEAEKE